MRCNPLAEGVPVRFTERETLRLILVAWLVRQGRITEFPKVKAITRVSTTV